MLINNVTLCYYCIAETQKIDSPRLGEGWSIIIKSAHFLFQRYNEKNDNVSGVLKNGDIIDEIMHITERLNQHYATNLFQIF